MTSKFLLAADYDGTLRLSRTISPEDIAAIHRWQAEGHLFCLCTGRALNASIELMKQDGIFPDLLIVGNGAAIGTMDGKFLAKHPLSKKETAAINQIARECGNTAIMCNAADGSLMTYSYIHLKHCTATVEQMLAEEHPLQFNAVFTEKPDAARCFTDRVNREVPGATAHLNGVHIDCTAYGIDKGVGVRTAAELLGIPLANCYTVGDNENDLPMLLPYHGTAIQSGNPDVIEKVGRSTPNIASLIYEILS